ncbi:hypothetical protein [Paracoccus simplex]|uniref:Uncharacterized protein n=1 Tax=Paracoccus simplex TaxID=2086346 RepID=A0ABV7S785_9RHOB
MLNVEVWEARTYVKQSDGEDYEFQDDISLGNFRVAALPAAGERIVITAYGAPDYGEGFSENIYVVQEVWHVARHIDPTGGQVTDWRETDNEPSAKVFVAFSHSRGGFHRSDRNHDLRRIIIPVQDQP